MADDISGPELDTRRRITAAAERLFRTLGYQKTNVADIARDLAMSPANVYRFFPSKADIRDAVGRQIMGEVEHAVALIAARPGPAHQRLADALLTMCRITKERCLSDKKMHEMVVVAMDESWDMVLAHLVTMDALLARIIADGMASGVFPITNPALAARCVKSAMIAFCHPQLLEECADFPEPTPEQQVAFCIAGLRHAAAGL